MEIISELEQQHQHFMEMALKEAQHAYLADEVPVGAVVVAEGQIIARAHNQVEQLKRATAHAELLALQEAFQHQNAKYLSQCTLYVTLEPCLMCAGALGWAKLQGLVFGASDSQRGYQRLSRNAIHPKTAIRQGLMATKSMLLLKRFFLEKRNKQQKSPQFLLEKAWS